MSTSKVVGIVVVLLVLSIVIGYGLRVADVFVERKIMVNSHQYIEGMEQRAGVLSANIAEIDMMISTGQGDKTKLLAQKRVLRSQLNAITQ